MLLSLCIFGYQRYVIHTNGIYYKFLFVLADTVVMVGISELLSKILAVCSYRYFITKLYMEDTFISQVLTAKRSLLFLSTKSSKMEAECQCPPVIIRFKLEEVKAVIHLLRLFGQTVVLVALGCLYALYSA